MGKPKTAVIEPYVALNHGGIMITVLLYILPGWLSSQSFHVYYDV